MVEVDAAVYGSWCLDVEVANDSLKQHRSPTETHIEVRPLPILGPRFLSSTRVLSDWVQRHTGLDWLAGFAAPDGHRAAPFIYSVLLVCGLCTSQRHGTAGSLSWCIGKLPRHNNQPVIH
jgi:hypothetical protein